MQDLQAQIAETQHTLNVLSHLSQVLERTRVEGTGEARALAKCADWLDRFAAATHETHGELCAQAALERKSAKAAAQVQAAPAPAEEPKA